MRDPAQPRPDIHIARPDELDAVAKVNRAAYQEYAKVMPRNAWKAYREDVTDVRSRLEASELIVASLDGKPVGAVTLYPGSSGSQATGWPEGWAGIRLLAVHPKYRGRGIGRALMEECLRRCRQRGTTVVGLHTTEAMDIARRMYERMGFVRTPAFDFHPRPGVTVMAYRLDL